MEEIHTDEIKTKKVIFLDTQIISTLICVLTGQVTVTSLW